MRGGGRPQAGHSPLSWTPTLLPGSRCPRSAPWWTDCGAASVLNIWLSLSWFTKGYARALIPFPALMSRRAIGLEQRIDDDAVRERLSEGAFSLTSTAGRFPEKGSALARGHDSKKLSIRSRGDPPAFLVACGSIGRCGGRFS